MSLVTPPPIERLRRKLGDKAKSEPEFRFYMLYDKVYRPDILAHAYAVCKHHAGAPGVDGVTFADIESRGSVGWLEGLRKELRERTYKPQPVRRVMIPKPGGGERPLGIPTIRDRVVQTAAKLILEPIFEADLDEAAHGYRPGRSAGEAIAKVHAALKSGQTDVVDADLSKYFDTIPHHELLRSVARRVVDHHMLRLIRMWLKTPVEEEDDHGHKRYTGGRKSKMGTPQGGVISPLLANIYMNRYLRHFRQQGKDVEFRATLINYADDFVILCRGKAREALDWTREAMGKLKLTMNMTKTCRRDARQETFNFLGYTFGPTYHRKTGQRYLGAWPSDKSVKRVKENVSKLLCPGNQDPLAKVVQRLNTRLRGWANYFDYGRPYKAYKLVDYHVLQRVQSFLRRRHKLRSNGRQRFNSCYVERELGVVNLLGTLMKRRALVSRS
jgi:RNA-directed DNA polymerase